MSNWRLLFCVLGLSYYRSCNWWCNWLLHNLRNRAAARRRVWIFWNVECTNLLCYFCRTKNYCCSRRNVKFNWIRSFLITFSGRVPSVFSAIQSFKALETFFFGIIQHKMIRWPICSNIIVLIWVVMMEIKYVQ